MTRGVLATETAALPIRKHTPLQRIGQPEEVADAVVRLGLERAEGVSPAVIDGAPRIVIVGDDGSCKEGRFARFVLLDPGQLQIAS